MAAGEKGIQDEHFELLTVAVILKITEIQNLEKIKNVSETVRNPKI